MARLEGAALNLVEIVEDLARDMETIIVSLPDPTGRTHERAMAKTARELARAVKLAVAEARRR
jgi:hypothetical protein